MIASSGIAHGLSIFVLSHDLIQKVGSFLGSCSRVFQSRSMPLRPGAYFASHSGVSQCLRAARGSRVAGMDGPIVQNDGDGFARRSRLVAMDVSEPFARGDETGDSSRR